MLFQLVPLTSNVQRSNRVKPFMVFHVFTFRGHQRSLAMSPIDFLHRVPVNFERKAYHNCTIIGKNFE